MLCLLFESNHSATGWGIVIDVCPVGCHAGCWSPSTSGLPPSAAVRRRKLRCKDLVLSEVTQLRGSWDFNAECLSRTLIFFLATTPHCLSVIRVQYWSYSEAQLAPVPSREALSGLWFYRL